MIKLWSVRTLRYDLHPLLPGPWSQITSFGIRPASFNSFVAYHSLQHIVSHDIGPEVVSTNKFADPICLQLLIYHRIDPSWYIGICPWTPLLVYISLF